MTDTVESFVRGQAAVLQAVVTSGWLAVAAAAAWRGRRCGRRGWLAVAAAAAVVAGEMAYPVRYDLTGWLRTALRAVGGDEAVRDRRPLQAAVLLLVVLPATAAAVTAAVRTRRLSRPGRLAVAGLVVSAAGFVVEAVSLHQVDHFTSVYWAMRFAGLGLTVAGLAGARVSRPGPAAAAGPSAAGRGGAPGPR
jgi:hypothetical protein